MSGSTSSLDREFRRSLRSFRRLLCGLNSDFPGFLCGLDGFLRRFHRTFPCSLDTALAGGFGGFFNRPLYCFFRLVFLSQVFDFLNIVLSFLHIFLLIALLVGSVFGIFLSGEDSGSGMNMQTAVQEINADYNTKLQAECDSVSYDVLEMSGSRAVWKEELAVYAVKTNTDPTNPQKVATMDDGKKQLFKNIFWEMNAVSSRTETKSETAITETDDRHGNIVQTETTVTRTYLYITVSHKSADKMADQYGFSQQQKDYLAELLAEENNSLWSAVLYGINAADDQIVTVALSQLGNSGGALYYSWYGFDSRVEWCACFVSWCANECGYIDTGVIPKYAGCVNGVQWFKDRGQWRTALPNRCRA